MQSSRKFAVTVGATMLALGLSAPFASATAIDFDFTSLGTNNTLLNKSETINGIKATGYAFSGGNLGHLRQAPLWLRKGANDNGLGVCSEGKSNCLSGGGNVNEVDNHGNDEAIVLENTNENSPVWTSLWVSSLDSNGRGQGPYESGTLFWGDTLASLASADANNSFGFTYGDFGQDVQGDILTLPQASNFDSGACYLGFIPGTASCLTNEGNGCTTDNDYLVYRGSVDAVPEPSSIGLFGLGLLTLGLGLRRRRRV